MKRRPPALTGTGAQARASALAFLDWAGTSTPNQHAEAAKLMGEARGNNDVAKVFCDEAAKAQRADFGRALLALSILGEMRNPVGAGCLRDVLHQPFPKEGKLVHGEILEQTAAGELQAKAVEGLAYMRDEAGDKEVFWAVSQHPSRIVRAAAIDAYLWNHNDSREARATLSKYIHPDEKIFLDRVRKLPGDSAETFNAKLATFLKDHPETRAVVPEHSTRKKVKQPERLTRGRQDVVVQPARPPQL